MKVTQSCPTLCDPMGYTSPWNSPGQNTGVGSLSLLQGIFPTQGSNPGLLHYRQILYQLSHKGSPDSQNIQYHFAQSPAINEGWSRFNFSHPKVGIPMILSCTSLMTKVNGAFFHVIFGHSYIFSCKVAVQVFCLVKKLNWLFITELYELFIYSGFKSFTS